MIEDSNKLMVYKQLNCLPLTQTLNGVGGKVYLQKQSREAPKGYLRPLEPSYWHLPVTPFHGELQKVKGKVDGFTEL
jgi:hypothetical protein